MIRAVVGAAALLSAVVPVRAEPPASVATPAPATTATVEAPVTSQQGFAIVTKDADFHQMSLVRGAPPKVVWIRVGNASTTSLRELLRARTPDIVLFGDDTEATLLTLGR